jgi:RNA polymerase sigma-70 factor, ECF subfamily
MQMETSAMKDTDDGTDMVSRIKADNQQAEAELVERYDRSVMSIIRREVGATTVADDLYQETFRIVLVKIRRGEVREPKSLSGFVCSVARNLVSEYFRRAARREVAVEVEEADSLPNLAPDQLEELLQKEKADFVRQVLKEMPNQRDRNVLFRYYLAEDRKEQICTDLGLTSQDFNRVLHRARERYRALYKRKLSKRLRSAVVERRALGGHFTLFRKKG